MRAFLTFNILTRIKGFLVAIVYWVTDNYTNEVQDFPRSELNDDSYCSVQ